MSRQVIYKCDKCGSEQATADQFWTVGVKASPLNYPHDMFVSNKHVMEVCRPCLESFGIHVQPTPKDQPQPPAPPTLEELISDIVLRTIEERA